MRMATIHLEGSARNIAILNTQGTRPPGGANASPAYLLVRVDQLAPAAPPSVPGGGTTTPARNQAPIWMATYDQDSASAGSSDLAGEMLELTSAEDSFIANAKALETAQAMVKRLFELTD